MKLKFRKDDFVVPLIVWTEQNYQRAVETSEDEMPETFAEWQKLLRETQSQIPIGAIIVPVEADPDAVLAWCRRTGRNVTTENRAAYAVNWLLENSVEE